MRILMAHNFYQQAGGEDQSFAAEKKMLEAHGHIVYSYTMHNDQIEHMSKQKVALNTFWNPDAYKEIRSLIKKEHIQIAHFQNTFPLISPAAYYAARAEGVPVVQSVRNYRFLCPNGTLFRNGQICEECVGKQIYWPAVQHACYRNNHLGTAVVTGMLASHKIIGTWNNKINRYIALTDFVKNKLIEGGFPEERIRVKPNSLIADPGIGKGEGGFALFVGRLTSEKGIETLLEAWKQISPNIPLKIAGDGPLSGAVKEAANNYSHIEWLGHRSHEQILELMKSAWLLVFPTEWYEPFGRVVIEAYAVGLPVVASNIGGTSSLIIPNKTGNLFEVGNIQEFIKQVHFLFDNPNIYQEMRKQSRLEFQNKYSTESNYKQLMNIYNELVDGNLCG